MRFDCITTRQHYFEIGSVLYENSLWFPSTKGKIIKPYQNVYNSKAYVDGRILESTFPLVIISHGSGGNNYSLSYLAEYLAFSGYFVISIKHTDKLLHKKDIWKSFYQYPERIKNTFNYLCKNSEYSQYIDFDNSTIIGFSLGGYAGVVNTGSIPNFNSIEQLNDVNKQLSNIDYSCFNIEQINRLILLDPAIYNAFSNTLKVNKTDTALFYSEYIDVKTMGQPKNYKNHFSNLKREIKLVGVGHYVYLNRSPKILQKISPVVCDEYFGLRKISHDKIKKNILVFLENIT